MRIDIRGTICSNDDKWVYDWLAMDATCPRDIQTVLTGAPPGEIVEIYINSPGGDLFAASDIYSAIRAFRGTVKIHVTGIAASAASVIMCAAWSDISPTAMVMIHCVGTSVSGNRKDLADKIELLEKADRAVCQAYVAKTGKTEAELLALMEREHWMTAQDAVDLGFCDAIAEAERPALVASFAAPLISSVAAGKLRSLLEQKEDTERKQRFINLGGTL